MTPTADEIERVARSVSVAIYGYDVMPNDMTLPYSDGSKIGKVMQAATAAIQVMNQRVPVAWACEERTMGVWYKRYVDQEPEGERYRNVAALYK